MTRRADRRSRARSPGAERLRPLRSPRARLAQTVEPPADGAVNDPPRPLLSDLPCRDRALILSLRLWLDGPEAQAEVWNAFAKAYGAADGRQALKAFEAYLAAVAAGAIRPLHRRVRTCRCLADDEMTLALVVRHAALGERAAALGWAMQLVPARAADRVVTTGAELGSHLHFALSVPALPAAPARLARLH